MFTNSRFAFGITRFLSLLQGKPVAPPLESEALDVLKRENLLCAQAAMDRLQIPVFLFAGTLLGWYRDFRLIPHDPDIDFGITGAAFREWLNQDPDLSRFQSSLAAEGFDLYRTLGKLDKLTQTGFELSFTRKGSAVDFFILMPDPERPGWLWNSVWYKQGWKRWKRHMRKQYHPWKGTTSISFLERTFLVPDDTEAYLVNHYGVNWRTPVKNWDYLHSPSNIDPA